jgi:multiple sugar transport system permease protein
MFVAPFLVVFAAMFIAPLAYAAYLSLYSSRLVGGTVFVGLQNYTQALQDSQFLSGLGRIAVFFLIQVPIMIILATFFALVLDSGRLRAPRVFRIAFFVPYAVPAVVAALMWGYLYGAKFGPFVQIAHDLGTAPPQFLTSGHLLPSIANIVTWEFAGYNMIILYAALLTIPPDLYEAASIDGAGAWGKFRHITLPGLAGVIATALLLRMIWVANSLDLILVMTGGGPGTATQTLPLHAFLTAWSGGNYGQGSALAVLLTLLLLGVVVTYVWRSRAE